MDKCRELQAAMDKGRQQAEILEKEVMELRGRAEQQKGAEEKAEEGGEDHRQVVVEKEEEESSSQSSSSGDDTGSSSEEEPERGRGDTFPGQRSEWEEKEAEQGGFELVEARARKRLAKRELQRRK